MRNPLSATTFLLRNANKTVPLTLVLMLVLFLVFGIVTLINSIPLSIRTIYGSLRHTSFLDPRGDPTQTNKLRQIVTKESPVALEPVMKIRASSIMVKSLVGKWDFVILAFTPADMKIYLDRVKATNLVGRLPKVGEPEAVISDPVARNLGLRIGDSILRPDNTEGYSPKPVIVTGLLKTDEWLVLTDRTYYEQNHLPPLDILVIMTTNPADQPVFDTWARNRIKGLRARVTSYSEIRRISDETFEILYKILNIVIGMLVTVVTLMMGMLMNIYQAQRLQEFGLLQALGYTKRQLLGRVVQESLIVVILGWILGLAASYGILALVKATLFDPRAFAMNLFDVTAFLYTVPVPIAIFCAAMLTVTLRFRNFDPVGVVDRRLV